MNKFKILIIFLLLFLSCGSDPCEGVAEGETVTIEFSEITHSIDIDVYTKNTYVDFDKLSYNINGKYFSKYGIHINFIERGDIENFLPCDRPIMYFVLDHVIGGANGRITGRCMYVAKSRTYSSTVAHEIGHLLGLPHIQKRYQNVMYGFEGNCVLRTGFNEEQVAKMKRKIELFNEL